MKIHFLIVGAQKGGTTALWDFLSEHAQIGMADLKEVHFFDNDELFRNGDVDYALYHQHFSHHQYPKMLGEATPIYMYWKSAAERIYHYHPSMKLIFLLRNPIERAYSNYMMAKERHAECLPFSLAIRLEKLRRLRSFPQQDRSHSYVDRGFYTHGIKRMLRYFPPNQMLFLKTEDLQHFHQQTLGKVCDFLEVPGITFSPPRMVFAQQYPPMQPSDRRFLQNIYKQEIASLEKLIGWDCSNWK